MTQEEIEPDYYEPPPPPPEPEQEHTPCGKLMAVLAAVLMLAWAGAVGASLFDPDFEVTETYVDSSISPSGVGGDDSLENSWN